MYTLVKLNTTTKQWIKVHDNYKSFQDVNYDITFEGVQYILSNNHTYTKEELPFSEMYKWSKLLLKKDLNKVYITKKNNIYKIVEKED